MTVAFIQCLKSEHHRFRRAHLQHQSPEKKSQQISVVPLASETSAAISSSNPFTTHDPCGAYHGVDGKQKTDATVAEHLVVRNLIECISHNFNNLLMGIWGNITLMRMHYDKSHPIGMQLLKMEQLIESGAFLIHMVLGYLGERRLAARRLRLNQIIQEFIDTGYHHPITMDRYRLKERLIWAATVQQPTMIAISIAKVLDILLRNLSHHRRTFSAISFNGLSIEKKLNYIDTMILKGQKLVEQLSLYAGEIKPEFVNTRVKPVLADVLREVAAPYSDLNLMLKDISDHCQMLMDRAMVSSALREIMRYITAGQPEHRLNKQYAVDAAPSVHIVCRSVKSNDYVAIDITDSKIPMSSLNLILDNKSFWEYPNGDKNKTMALAAAIAVIKAHGGKIGGGCKKDSGNILQILLPLN